MNRFLVVLLVPVALCTSTAPIAAQSKPPAPTRPGAIGIAPSDTTADARIIREVHDHQKAVSDVEHLADDIGGRLTGSESLVRAHAWAESTMTARGVSNVHRESYEFGKAWIRGPATARLLTQNRKELIVAGLGWGGGHRRRGWLRVTRCSCTQTPSKS